MRSRLRFYMALLNSGPLTMKNLKNIFVKNINKILGQEENCQNDIEIGLKKTWALSKLISRISKIDRDYNQEKIDPRINIKKEYIIPNYSKYCIVTPTGNGLQWWETGTLGSMEIEAPGNGFFSRNLRYFKKFKLKAVWRGGSSDPANKDRVTAVVSIIIDPVNPLSFPVATEGGGAGVVPSPIGDGSPGQPGYIRIIPFKPIIIDKICADSVKGIMDYIISETERYKNIYSNYGNNAANIEREILEFLESSISQLTVEFTYALNESAIIEDMTRAIGSLEGYLNQLWDRYIFDPNLQWWLGAGQPSAINCTSGIADLRDEVLEKLLEELRRLTCDQITPEYAASRFKSIAEEVIQTDRYKNYDCP